MLKKAAYTYIHSFHFEKWKNMNFFSLYMISYLLILMPMIWHIFESARSTVGYYLRIIPFFSLVLQNMVVLVLKKEMFLSPMSEQERKKYAAWLLTLKLTVPMLVSVLCLSIDAAIFGNHPMAFTVSLFSFFSGNVSVVLSTYNTKQPVNNYSSANSGALGAMQIINMIFAVLTILILTLCELQGDTWGLDDTILSGISVGVQFIFIILIFKKYTPQVIAEAIDYERCYEIAQREAEVKKIRSK